MHMGLLLMTRQSEAEKAAFIYSSSFRTVGDGHGSGRALSHMQKTRAGPERALETPVA